MKNTKHICKILDEILSGGKAHIDYIPKYREYHVNCKDNPMTSYHLLYCPWCGKKFPKQLRRLWFEILEKEYNLDDPWSDEQEKLVPKEFTTDEWWKKRSL